MSKLTRENAILPFTPAADLTGKEGYAVSVDDDGTIYLYDNQNEAPFGIIIHGTNPSEKTSVAVMAGGLAGTVKVKLSAAVTNIGTNLFAMDDAIFNPTAGTSAFLCAQALETGVAGELIEALLFRPQEVVV